MEVSFYLDTRRKRNDGTYPLKLHVYFERKVERWYKLPYYLTKEIYERSYLSIKPRNEFKELKVNFWLLKQRPRK